METFCCNKVGHLLSELRFDPHLTWKNGIPEPHKCEQVCINQGVTVSQTSGGR